MNSKPENRWRVLAVDDNDDGLFALEKILRFHGFDVSTATSGAEALKILTKEPIDVMLLDIMMPGMDGFEVTTTIRADDTLKFMPILLLTARDTLEDITKGLELGADDYVKKPFKQEELIARVHAALRMKKVYLELQRSQREITELRKQAQNRHNYDKMIGKNRLMQQMYELIEKVAPTTATVLIQGESGSGKELVAKALHSQSNRKDRSFIAVNCSAFPEEILESELFGHVKGSFSGAHADKIGLFAAADKGTLFLDEIGEMSPKLQAKFLRVLQDGTFLQVGSVREQKVDVRIVAATNRDLPKMIQSGAFREDLYYRLNVITINVPPLRDRIDDIPILVESFLVESSERNKKKDKIINEELLSAFMKYNWPGNVRQLYHEIERLVILSGEVSELSVDYLSPTIKQLVVTAESSLANVANLSGKLKDVIQQVERDLIQNTLDTVKGNRSEAARVLGISRSYLLSKLKEFS